MAQNETYPPLPEHGEGDSAQHANHGRRRRRTAAERRAQMNRSNTRTLCRLLRGLVSIDSHRGNSLSRVGEILIESLQPLRTNTDRNNRGLCRHYARGKCTYGDACRFSNRVTSDDHDYDDRYHSSANNHHRGTHDDYCRGTHSNDAHDHNGRHYHDEHDHNGRQVEPSSDEHDSDHDLYGPHYHDVHDQGEQHYDGDVSHDDGSDNKYDPSSLLYHNDVHCRAESHSSDLDEQCHYDRDGLHYDFRGAQHYKLDDDEHNNRHDLEDHHYSDEEHHLDKLHYDQDDSHYKDGQHYKPDDDRSNNRHDLGDLHYSDAHDYSDKDHNDGCHNNDNDERRNDEHYLHEHPHSNVSHVDGHRREEHDFNLCHSSHYDLDEHHDSNEGHDAESRHDTQQVDTRENDDISDIIAILSTLEGKAKNDAYANLPLGLLQEVHLRLHTLSQRHDDSRTRHYDDTLSKESHLDVQILQTTRKLLAVHNGNKKLVRAVVGTTYIKKCCD